MYYTVPQLEKALDMCGTQIRVFCDRYNIPHTQKLNEQNKKCRYYLVDKQFKKLMCEWLQIKVDKVMDKIHNVEKLEV